MFTFDFESLSLFISHKDYKSIKNYSFYFSFIFMIWEEYYR